MVQNQKVIDTCWQVNNQAMHLVKEMKNYHKLVPSGIILKK